MAGSGFLNRAWICSLLAGVGAIVAFPTFTSAQVVADPSIGTVVTPNGTTFQITGGTAAGNRNLFHSFSRFDVPIGGVADFQNNPNIGNIFSRVTGGTPSQINGIIRAGGTANLFLMNPSGIIFGQNARLDVGGSFVATTANAIQFGDRGFFNASLSEPPSQLLAIDPSALVFSAQLANPGQILVQGNGQGVRQNTNLIDTQDALRVSGERTLALVGGELNLEGATLKTAGGRIELGSVAPGNSVKLVSISKGWALDYTSVQNFQDVQLIQQATVDASGAGGGDVQVQGRQIKLVGGSQIEASTLGSQVGGNLALTASDSIDFRSSVTDRFYTGLYAQVYRGANGTGGSITVTANQFKLTGNYAIASTSTYGSGQGGNLTIHANDLVEATGPNQSNSLIRLEADAAGNDEGKGGNVTIDTRQLRVKSAQVSASTTGTGQAGNLTVRATDSVELSGEILDTTDGAPGGLFAIVNNGATGQGGNLTINTGRLSISDGSKAQAISFGRGNSGNVDITANDVEVFETALPNRYTTGIFVGAGLDPSNTELAQGGRGNLTIRGNRVSVRGGEISATTQGQGDAGGILIQARDLVEVIDTASQTGIPSTISADVDSGATGHGGDLTIYTRKLVVQGGQITASTSGLGNAGNLTIHATDSVDLSGENFTNRNGLGSPGGLFAQVDVGGVGQSGNMSVTTPHLSVSDGSKVQVATFGNGNAGNLKINADSVEVFETAKYNSYETGIFAGVELDPLNIELPRGTGGNLEISTNYLSLRGGSISVGTYGVGDAGKLRIQARNSIVISPSTDPDVSYSRITGSVRSNATGRGGDVSLLAKSITLTGNGSSISSTVNRSGTGQGGNIDIQANSLELNDHASITTRSQGNGAAGNVWIQVKDRLNLTNSNITTSADASSGGAINITGGKIRLIKDSDISSSVASGVNGGGDIRIAADYILALNDSDIFAFSEDGQGGNISLSRAYFGIGYQPSSLKADPQSLQGNDRPDINATGQVSSGTVTTPDNSFIQNGLTQLSDNLIDPNTLLANSCIVRSREQNGSFLVTGSGGLPVRPGDAPPSSFPTGEVRSLPSTETQGDRPWQLGDAIVEPQGIYRLPNGKLVMSRECQTQ